MCGIQTRTPHLWVLSTKLVILIYTIKNEYKFICEYPSDVILKGHCVVKLVDNDNNNSNHNYIGARAVVGGRNNHLLFIIYGPNDISLFDLNTFQFIKHDILPTKDSVLFQCFVSKSENEQGQEMMKTRQDYQLSMMKITTLSISSTTVDCKKNCHT
ncbi:hypothetical protein RFI_30840 [Reticulomyxa filosa]|uniref:Uncharacterized protein n=1 Tax=Reticulomyxa filosa TaxID=46433 RepID=X6LZH6_RETFI|nr:hypothetical protein RFI_30840 [Reticulomyxa filosa]|eukprot:ETO06552.1 hypothetical protein RFI_30840 [Reticulomyxa filosa]